MGQHPKAPTKQTKKGLAAALLEANHPKQLLRNVTWSDPFLPEGVRPLSPRRGQTPWVVVEVARIMGP